MSPRRAIPDGSRDLVELYSVHLDEVAAMGRNDQPLRARQRSKAAGALGEHESAGRRFILDAAGPWIRLSRDDLAPVLALAD